MIRRAGPASALALGALILPPLGSVVLFTYMNTIGTWLRGHEDIGLVMYAAGFAILSGLALLPTYASAILGGWAFGFALGFPAALAGFLGGALIGYTICRSVSQDRVEKIIAEKPTWKAVRDALVGGGFWRTLGIVALVRVPPNSPFALTNLVMASVKVPPLPFALGTLIGMAPRTGLVLFLAVQLRDGLAAADAAKQGQPWWVYAVGIAVTLVVLVVIATIAKHAIARVTGVTPARAKAAGR